MTEETKTPDMNGLTKQIEYYLSEANLKKDKYFNDIIKENKVLIQYNIRGTFL